MASPFFFVDKKDGKLWPCQDYQALNEGTIKNAYPLPLISVTFHITQSTPSPSPSVQWHCCRHIVGSLHHHAYVPFPSSAKFHVIPDPPSSYQTQSHNKPFHSTSLLHLAPLSLCNPSHLVQPFTHFRTWQSTELAPHGYFASPHACFTLPCIFLYLIFLLPCARCHITNPYVSALII